MKIFFLKDGYFGNGKVCVEGYDFFVVDFLLWKIFFKFFAWMFKQNDNLSFF